jgi:galactose mutarotase-like enzyme
MSILEAVHPSVERDTVEGFEGVTLAAGALEATFVPSLGTVMGMPLLHPWANRLARDELILDGHRVRLPGPPSARRDDHGLPIHGLLGAHPGWSVHEADADRWR